MLITHELRHGELLLSAHVIRMQADPSLKRRLSLRSGAMASVIRCAWYIKTGAGFTGTGHIDLFLRLKQMLICRKDLWIAGELDRRGYRLAGAGWEDSWI